jgi:hypothetical protein
MEEHDEIAEELEQDAQKMDGLTDELDRDITDQREDWESKKKADAIPGAQPLPGEGEEEEEPPDIPDVEETDYNP